MVDEREEISVISEDFRKWKQPHEYCLSGVLRAVHSFWEPPHSYSYCWLMSFGPSHDFSSIVAGVIGKPFIRAPIACEIALATAAIVGTNGTSPKPRTPNGCPSLATSTTTVSIIGRSRLVGILWLN